MAAAVTAPTVTRPCPSCGRPIECKVGQEIPSHTDLRTGGRSVCPASGLPLTDDETRSAAIAVADMMRPQLITLALRLAAGERVQAAALDELGDALAALRMLVGAIERAEATV